MTWEVEEVIAVREAIKKNEAVGIANELAKTRRKRETKVFVEIVGELSSTFVRI